MKNRWYDMTFGEVAQGLDVDLKNGLTKSQVHQRMKKYGKNTVYSVKKGEEKPYLMRALSNLSVFLLSLVAIVHAIIESEYRMLVIPLLLLVSMLIVLYAYSKSKLILEENAMQSIPRIKVIRDGKLIFIRQDSIVPGDVFIFSAGDIIPCDARLIEASNLHVLEKSMGKEASPIKKDAEFKSSNTIPPQQRINMVFAMGVVLKGRGRAVAVATGKSTLISIKGENVPISSGEKIEVLGSFEKYSTYLSIFMSGMIILLTVLAILFDLKLGIYNSFMLMLTLSVASMCELLPMLAKIIISCGIFGAGKRKNDINSGVMIKNSGKIETLKDVDCLVFHKESLFAESDIGIEPCQFYNGQDDFHEVLKKVIISKGIYGASRLNASNEKNENVISAEDEKIIKIAKECGIYNKRLDENYPALEHKRQVFKGISYETTLVKAGNKNVFYAVGTSIGILKLCEYERTNQGIVPMDPERRRAIENIVAEKMRSGSKVICVATSEHIVDKSAYRSPNVLFSQMVFEGAVNITRPVINGAIEYIKLCNSAGIKTVMICDDISETNVMLARNIGVISSAEESVSVTELNEMSAEMIRTNIPVYKVYQGLSAIQLKFIVSQLKSDCKRTVAYLGRELSHLGIISEASIGFAELLTVTERAARKGIAVGKDNLPASFQGSKDTSGSGCEALKFSSDVILSRPDTDGNGGFNSAVLSIIAAKGIWRNLYLMCQYMALTFSSRLVLALFSMISGFSLITPIQLLFMGVVCDLIAIIMIAFEKPEKSILKSKTGIFQKGKGSAKKGFLSMEVFRHLLIYSGVSALGTLLIIIALLLLRVVLPGAVSSVTTVAFIGSIAYQLALIAEIVSTGSIFRSKIKVYNIYPLYLVLIGAVIAVGMIFTPVGAVLDIVFLSAFEWVAVIIPAVLIIVIFELFKLFIKKRKGE